MIKLLLLIAFFFFLLVPTSTFGGQDYSTLKGYWPVSAGDCSAYKQRGQCSYLLCVCYAGCNSESGAIDLERKGLCDDQFYRCVQDNGSY